MEKYDLIALDIDGTLLNSRLELTEGNRIAIERAHAAGKHVVLSTGRCLSELRDILGRLPQIRYLVCENGSCVYDLKYEQDVHLAPVRKEDILYILDLMRGEDVVLQAFHNNMSFFNQPDGVWTGAFNVGEYREVFDRTSIWDERLFDTFAQRPFRVEKLNLYFRNQADRQRIHGVLEEKELALAETIGYMLEVTSADADKGHGLNMLCAHLGIGIERTIAVGDSSNDVAILKAAGLSAAMGNASPEAMEAADIITADCDHDGVAEVIYKYLL